MAESRNVRVEETSKQIDLMIERAIGTYGSIRITYQTHAYTALPSNDYVEIKNGALIMSDKQKTAKIPVYLLEEDEPELGKIFYVNITGVEKVPKTFEEGM